MPELYRSRPDWDATLAAAAERLDIDVVAVEKDYWVCQVLRGLATSEYGASIVFKGGTSLEKMRLTERFSEDIDALVLVPADVKKQGKKTHQKYLKHVVEAIDVDGIRAAEDAKSGGNPDSFHRHVHMVYREPVTGSTGLVDSGRILLELGESAGPNPNLPHDVLSLIGRQLAEADVTLADYDDLAPFGMTFLHPGRTLLEKLLRVEAYMLDPDNAKPGEAARIGRQLYDIWALLADARVQVLLADESEKLKILEDAALISQKFGPQGDKESVGAAVERPDGGFASSPAYDPTGPMAAQMRAWHEEAMTELHYGKPPGPSFDEVCARIAEHADRL
jgi:hypothetical protein